MSAGNLPKWYPESEKGNRKLGMLILIVVVFVMLALSLWQWAESKKALASYAEVSNNVYALATPNGFITFRSTSTGAVNTCEPGAQCFELKLEKPVYRINSIRLSGQLVVISYIAVGESGASTSMRALYDLENRLEFVPIH